LSTGSAAREDGHEFVVAGAFAGVLSNAAGAAWDRQRAFLRAGAAAAVAIMAFAGLVGLAAVPLAEAASAGAAPPTLVVSPPVAAVGQMVQVTGTNLPPGAYQVQVCGDSAAQGSPDCAATAGASTQADSKGLLSTQLPVVLPPTQCPCVVALFPVGAGSQVTTPLSIEGVSSNAAPATAPPAPASHIVVLHAGLTGSTPIAQWFGLSVSRTLVVTLRNTGTAPASWIDIFVNMGNSPVASRHFTHLGAGQVLTYQIPVTIPALTVGGRSFNGNVDTGTAQLINFKTPVSVWPIGLLLLILVVAQLLLLFSRNAMRRRHQRKNPPRVQTEAPGAAERERVEPVTYPVPAQVIARILSNPPATRWLWSVDNRTRVDQSLGRSAGRSRGSDISTL
jgi:hypothetical protein